MEITYIKRKKMSRLSMYKHLMSTDVFGVRTKVKEARKNPRKRRKGGKR